MGHVCHGGNVVLKRCIFAGKKWVLYFKGGGWCTSPATCAARARGIIGSSNTLRKHQPTFAFGGPLDTDPAMNPAFAHFHHVVLWYCDGGSFSGDRAEPQVVDGTNVWYRGKRNLDAMLAFLKQGHGPSRAKSAPRFVRRALLPPQANAGSLYRRAKRS